MDYAAHYQHLTVETDGDGVALVTLNRPEVMNATNRVLHGELGRIWTDLDRDAAVRTIIVTGAGNRAFSAGGDLSEMVQNVTETMNERYERALLLMKEAADIVYTMLNCDKVIVSAINGVAVGAGLAVALTADISIVGEDVRLTDGHTRLGVAAGDHACATWPILCGLAKAKYYLLTADFLDGREAERIGLVSKAVPTADVLVEADRIAHQLAAAPQQAQRFTKRALNQWARLGGIASFDYSLAVELLGFFGPDADANIKAITDRWKAQQE